MAQHGTTHPLRPQRPLNEHINQEEAIPASHASERLTPSSEIERVSEQPAIEPASACLLQGRGYGRK
jgi:hypothetical protein